MKSENLGIGTLHTPKELKELLQETKETLATDVRQEDLSRSFGIVDMWNRQKRQRTSRDMRRWLN